MSEPSLIDVFTVAEYRRGPSVLGLVMIALLFAVPGFVAPVNVLQLVAGVWFVAAVATAARDIVHIRASSAA